MRRITAFVLSVAVLAGMTFTTLAAPTENIAAGGEQEETVLPAQPDMAGLELDVEEKNEEINVQAGTITIGAADGAGVGKTLTAALSEGTRVQRFNGNVVPHTMVIMKTLTVQSR